MFEGIKSMLGIGPTVDYKELMNKGAQLIDVRTKKEFETGHIKGSINIPLQNIKSSFSIIDKKSPLSRAAYRALEVGRQETY